MKIHDFYKLIMIHDFMSINRNDNKKLLIIDLYKKILIYNNNKIIKK